MSTQPVQDPAQLQARWSSSLMEQYQKLDDDELVRRANNREATAVSREAARRELERRSASEGSSDSGIFILDPEEPVKRGEATPIAVLALLFMAVATVALFLHDPKSGMLMGVATGTGFSFVFPHAGRFIGLGLVSISLWLFWNLYTGMPLYVALFMSPIPLAMLGIGLNMVVTSFGDE